MKKLFALAIVAGMVFVSCGNQPATDPAVNTDADEVTMTDEQQDSEDVAEMQAEEVAEEAAE